MVDTMQNAIITDNVTAPEQSLADQPQGLHTTDLSSYQVVRKAVMKCSSFVAGLISIRWLTAIGNRLIN